MEASGKAFINNFRNARMNPFSASSSPSLITRGDIQKRNRERQLAQAEVEVPKSEEQTQESLPAVPKAPSFRYKNPAVDNNIAFWKNLMRDDVMRHYDDFMYILDEAKTLDNLDDIKTYMEQLKGTTGYKYNLGMREWINDLEALYYDLDGQYDLSLPVDIMRRQTIKAKAGYNDGYRTKPDYTQKLEKFDKPEFPSLAPSFK